jgi:hypothetical protein
MRLIALTEHLEHVLEDLYLTPEDRSLLRWAALLLDYAEQEGLA